MECLRYVVHPFYWNKRTGLSTSILYNAGYKIVCTILTLMICGGVCVTGATFLRSEQLSEMSNLRTKTIWPKIAMSALIIQRDSKRWTQWTQTAYLLKLVIPTTNILPPWRLNVETKTKSTLHSSRRLSFNELTNAKSLVLHSSHFALN